MKLKSKFTKSAMSLAFVGIIGLSGCAAQETTNTSSASSSVSSSSATGAASSSTNASSTITYDTHFDDDDLSWDESAVKTIDLSHPEATDGVTVEDGVITITAAGDYKLTGTLDDGQVVVSAGDEDTVRLILNNASITNSSGAAIDVESANEVLLYSNEGTTNTVSDGSTYSATDNDDPDAAIFSRSDLTLAGKGALKVTGNYKDGIASSDGLVIASGSLNVTDKNNGIKGKDYVDILDGTIKVTATEGDGIKSTNSEEDERGWARLQNGSVTVAAADDGFKAEKELEISGGKLTVEQSNEGIEGQYITLTGGEITVTSDDDGINASVPSTDDTGADFTSTDSASTDTAQQGQAPSSDMGGQPPAGDMGGGQPPAGNMGGDGGMDTVEDATITVSGGTINVTAEGDGFDSNGTASMSGGTLTVNGPSRGGNGVFDTAGDFAVTGGTLLAGGTSDMFVVPATDGQGYIESTELSTSEGDVVTVLGSSGKTVASYTATDKGTQLFFASTEGRTAGETYTLQVNGSDAGTVTAE